jgi:hypothetical protein
MLSRQAYHDRTVRDLESRLRQKYPHQTILTNVTYGADTNNPVGEIDVLRFSESTVYMYEVKTGEYKLRKAIKQYTRFCAYVPELNIKGVYYHPNLCKRIG